MSEDPDRQVVFLNVTTTQRDLLTAQTGGVIFNTTTNKLQCYDGSTWNDLFLFDLNTTTVALSPF